MEHNPRVIELGSLSRAMRAMGDVDPSQADAADRMYGRVRRAIRLDALTEDEGAALRQEAQALGAVVIDGRIGSGGTAPRIVVSDDETLKRLGSGLESRGLKSMGAAVRLTLAAYERTAFTIAFADGDRMDLAAETRVMGILNVTPDSFSDGGALPNPQAAVEAAARLADEGADLIDVGGESTRPGAMPVTEDEEIRRVVPVVQAIKRDLPLRVSVDTSKAKVARLAIEAGADLVNDVSAFTDPAMLAALRGSRTPVVVMHRRGTARTMQHDTAYVDLLSSIVGFLRKRIEAAASAGIPDDKILVDPGLGFGKSATGNLQILRELATLRSVGRPIVVGASRKSFIGTALDLPVDERLEGGLAIAAWAAWQGAQVIRTHDVAETKRTTRMIDAIRRT
ncbi:MAG TPA: dihydropteroate synthase [Candidatus Polarisedimenticolaceae bacterium]|nr:dihydropteroate synthase [Candidatus Polarisedimenticolaceae bacterium]